MAAPFCSTNCSSSDVVELGVQHSTTERFLLQHGSARHSSAASTGSSRQASVRRRVSTTPVSRSDEARLTHAPRTAWAASTSTTKLPRTAPSKSRAAMALSETSRSRALCRKYDSSSHDVASAGTSPRRMYAAWDSTSPPVPRPWDPAGKVVTSTGSPAALVRCRRTSVASGFSVPSPSTKGAISFPFRSAMVTTRSDGSGVLIPASSASSGA
mmetsp:Transcript_2479/g.6937  ORF Transcript_2479/g.6937 Transcript_2479/m.6937 type:complete len:213 (-) Transcript_2479:673-1311(-)